MRDDPGIAPLMGKAIIRPAAWTVHGYNLERLHYVVEPEQGRLIPGLTDQKNADPARL